MRVGTSLSPVKDLISSVPVAGQNDHEREDEKNAGATFVEIERQIECLELFFTFSIPRGACG
jgi:hypothetical protein